jgi:hypothetical protein
MDERSRRSRLPRTSTADLANLSLQGPRIPISRSSITLKKSSLAEGLFASIPQEFSICNGRRKVIICSAVVAVKNVRLLSNIACMLLTCFSVYVWRVRELSTAALQIGVVCEHVYTPESEHADLRLMSFDVSTSGSSHTIAMVFSDSSIKVS